MAFIDSKKYIESSWDKKFGDRNELVFISQEMDQQSIERDLDFCLQQKMNYFLKSGKKE